MVLALFAGACSDDSGSDEDRSGSSDGDGNGSGGDDFDLVFGPTEAESVPNEEAIEVVQEYWEDNEDSFGFDFEPLPDERVSAVPGDRELVCDGFTITPLDVEGNAFIAPCSEGLTMAWDPVLIDETLLEQFGPAAGPVVFAHEFGHVVQFESGILDITGQGLGEPPSIVVETQADCLAGAWTAEQVDEGYGPFDFDESLITALNALLFVRDSPGSDPNAPAAHGSGFDRVSAFQDGFRGGPEACATFVEDPPRYTEFTFSNPEEEANQGNLPFDEVVPLIEEDLDYFFDEVIDLLGDVGDPLDSIPEDELRQLHAEIGDGAVATLYGMIWAEAAQEEADSDADGEDALRQRTCLVGAWLGDILEDQGDGTVERPSTVSLSPGDLDETIITVLELTEQAMSEPEVAFDAVGSMRDGVNGGAEACDL
jgi:hypothetical protein